VSQAHVELRQLNGLKSIIRDHYIKESPFKMEMAKKALGASRRGELPITAASIADVLKLTRTLFAKQLSSGSDEDGDHKAVLGHGGPLADRIQVYVHSAQNGVTINLPPITERYGPRVTDGWIKAPVNMGCLAKSSTRIKGRGEALKPLPGHEYLTSAKARQYRELNRRLLTMLQTPNVHLNCKVARGRVAEECERIRSVPSLIAVIESVSSDSDKKQVSHTSLPAQSPPHALGESVLKVKAAS
jgi:hypothetical protein